MRLTIYRDALLIGSVLRSRPGVVYAWGADGSPIGTFGDMDAATAALERRATA